MPSMIRLDPAPKQDLPREGWALIATEAGRYKEGLHATIQLWNGQLQGCQQLALAHPELWVSFVADVAAQGRFTSEEVVEALHTLTAAVEIALREMEESAKKGTPSQASQLVELAADASLFHSPEGEAFATIKVGDHRETWPCKAKGLRRWLAHRFFEKYQSAPSTQAIQDALGVLEGMALFTGPEYPVFTRLAEYEGVIYLDLANDGWEVLEITATGWRVMTRPPVKFRRARGMLPLPHPASGGHLRELRRFVNIQSEADWLLFQSALVTALRPRGPYPVIPLHGEQGSAKSTTARIFKALVDPNAVPLRAALREERDLMIAATNGWCLAFDNLSHLPEWLSDAICRLATGGGFATRELYTDSDEILFDAMRPVILTGIEEVATRGDLLDRAIILYLPSIPEEERRPEVEFWQDFEAARPHILGALLNAVSTCLGNVAMVQLERLPRMADFAVWAVAAESRLDCSPGLFIQAYTGNREAANELVLEASLIVPPLRAVTEAHPWEGPATELLDRLNAKVDEQTKKKKGWPGNARALSSALRRLAPNLRAVGIDVAFPPRQAGRRRLIVRPVKLTQSRERIDQ